MSVPYCLLSPLWVPGCSLSRWPLYNVYYHASCSPCPCLYLFMHLYPSPFSLSPPPPCETLCWAGEFYCACRSADTTHCAVDNGWDIWLRQKNNLLRSGFFRNPWCRNGLPSLLLALPTPPPPPPNPPPCPTLPYCLLSNICTYVT